jgi:hypothetical protein
MNQIQFNTIFQTHRDIVWNQIQLVVMNQIYDTHRIEYKCRQKVVNQVLDQVALGQTRNQLTEDLRNKT